MLQGAPKGDVAGAVLVTAEEVVEHDFHNPPDRSQVQRDRTFWLGARWALMPA